jgi:hypothetical protein
MKDWTFELAYCALSKTAIRAPKPKSVLSVTATLLNLKRSFWSE